MKRLLFIAASLLPPSVFSAIDIQPHVLEIEQESTVVTVTNYGLDPEYVTVQLYQLNNPGESPEQESLISVGEQRHPALFAFPAKLTLGPKQSGRIFLKALSTPDKEQVYRLAVAPVNNLQVTGGHTAVLGVQLSYMGLVRHLAASPQPQWAHRCLDGGIVLENTGNTRLQWRQLKTQEQDIEDFNLYPDQHRQLAVSDVRGMIEDKPFNLRCIAG